MATEAGFPGERRAWRLRVTAALLRIGLAACLGLLPAAPSAEAATLGEVMSKVASNPTPQPPCLEPAAAPPVPSERPLGRCAVNTVGVLYLGLLRDRERLEILRAAIARQHSVLADVQQRAESGIGSYGESLLAEIELKRWQSQEAEIIGSILHTELFFATAMESEPSEFVRPRLAPSAWPEDEAVALVALAQQESIPGTELPAAEIALKHAWIDYRAARRALELLEPMGAFADDLARASHDQYSLGQLALGTLLTRLRDAVLLQEAMVNAEYRLLAIQLAVLDLLGRRAARE